MSLIPHDPSVCPHFLAPQMQKPRLIRVGDVIIASPVPMASFTCVRCDAKKISIVRYIARCSISATRPLFVATIGPDLVGARSVPTSTHTRTLDLRTRAANGIDGGTSKFEGRPRSILIGRLCTILRSAVAGNIHRVNLGLSPNCDVFLPVHRDRFESHIPGPLNQLPVICSKNLNSVLRCNLYTRVVSFPA